VHPECPEDGSAGENSKREFHKINVNGESSDTQDGDEVRLVMPTLGDTGRLSPTARRTLLAALTDFDLGIALLAL